jgi:hypothetical protein
MVRVTAMALVLVGSFCPAVAAEAYDRVASVGESPISAETGPSGNHGMLIDLLRALDRVTHSSTKIVLRPFARSFIETAAGHADFHIPFIQNDRSPAPKGLVYVTETDFGEVQFVIYSRKDFPLNAETVAHAKAVETEAGHVSFFPFPVTETHCVPCSLDKILVGRTDALIVSSDIVDPLLDKPQYKAIHRAFYKAYPVRALVPANADSAATRRYLAEGVKRLKETGELWSITRHQAAYSDWQP